MRSCTATFKENLLCNIVAGKAIITSVVAGDITLNPVVFASFLGFGLVVKAVASFKKYDKKAEKANFVRIEYKKILDAIRFYLRGEPFNEKTFLDKLKMVDYFISDHCMEIPAKVETKYSKLFTAIKTLMFFMYTARTEGTDRAKPKETQKRFSYE